MRILIVEDERKIAEFLRHSLEAEQYAVDVAEDGDQGSRLGRVNDYDLIVLDYNLPKKNGLEVCREIREKGKACSILVLSVKSEAVHKVDLLNAGADDYLAKPFALAELLARVRALLRRPQTLAREQFTIGDLSLDSASGEVKLGKKNVVLTRKEFMLLQYLMQNEGVILSRGMILEHVWDMSVDIFSNTIESHILSLRKKIGDQHRHELIQTFTGRGYRIGV